MTSVWSNTQFSKDRLYVSLVPMDFKDAIVFPHGLAIITRYFIA